MTETDIWGLLVCLGDFGSCCFQVDRCPRYTKHCSLHSLTFLYTIVVSVLSGFRGFILQDTQRKVAVSFELYLSASLCRVLHFIFGEKTPNLSMCIVAGIFSRSINTSYTFQWERVGNMYERYVYIQGAFVPRQPKKLTPKWRLVWTGLKHLLALIHVYCSGKSR